MTGAYYVDEQVTLYHGNWQELINPDLSADLIVTDPPYGETQPDWDRWPYGWPAQAARHSSAMRCWGSMRMFLDHRDEFDAWKLSHDVVWERHNLASNRYARVHDHALHWYARSCSTLIAARSTGRPAMGFEVRESRCEKATLRLSQGMLL